MTDVLVPWLMFGLAVTVLAVWASWDKRKHRK